MALSDQPASLNVSQRNTLAAVYNLSRGGYGATVYELAARMSISQSAAAARMRALRDKRLVAYGGKKRHPSDAPAHQMTRVGLDALMSPWDYMSSSTSE